MRFRLGGILRRFGHQKVLLMAVCGPVHSLKMPPIPRFRVRTTKNSNTVKRFRALSLNFP
jgi:hypothetical protein